MQWKTSLSHVTETEERIRGYDLEELVGKLSFTESIWLLFRGELPNKNQTNMLDAIFVSVIDHGIGVASVMASRIISSAGASFSAALAGGILSIGSYHGGAITDAAEMLQNALKNNEQPEAVVARYKQEGKRLPGFGHRVLKHDPRSEKLIKLAQSYDCVGDHIRLVQKIEHALNVGREKPLPLNVDGTIGAIISDLGFDAVMANGFFAIGRMAGLVAHVAEERTREKPLRRLEPSECLYDGLPPREL